MSSSDRRISDVTDRPPYRPPLCTPKILHPLNRKSSLTLSSPSPSAAYIDVRLFNWPPPPPQNSPLPPISCRQACIPRAEHERYFRLRIGRRRCCLKLRVGRGVFFVLIVAPSCAVTLCNRHIPPLPPTFLLRLFCLFRLIPYPCPRPVVNLIKSSRFSSIHSLCYYLILFTLINPTQSNILACSYLLFSLHSAPRPFYFFLK